MKYIVHSVWNKKEEDGSWIVKIIHKTRTIWGYGDSLQEVKEDCRNSLESAFTPDKFKVNI